MIATDNDNSKISKAKSHSKVTGNEREVDRLRSQNATSSCTSNTTTGMNMRFCRLQFSCIHTEDEKYSNSKVLSGQLHISIDTCKYILDKHMLYLSNFIYY